jgi:hypothetical protein
MLKKVLLFSFGAVLSTTSIWAFVYFTHCVTSAIFFACPEQQYFIPLMCTFIWPLLIGLSIVGYTLGLFEQISVTDTDKSKDS